MLRRFTTSSSSSSSPSRTRHQYRLFSTSSLSSSPLRLSRRSHQQQQQIRDPSSTSQNRELQKLARAPLASDSLEQLKSLPSISSTSKDEAAAVLPESSSMMNQNNSNSEQRLIIKSNNYIPWSYVKHDDEILACDEFLVSLSIPRQQSFRAQIGRNQAFGFNTNEPKNQNSSTMTMFPLEPSSLERRISKPLENLFHQFPDLVLEGQICRFDTAEDCRKDLISAFSTSSQKNTNNSSKNDNEEEREALISGTQFIASDIAFWSKINPLHTPSFEIRTQLLYKLLRTCVDPEYLRCIGNPVMTSSSSSSSEKQLHSLMQSFVTEEHSGGSTNRHQQQTGNNNKPISYLGNVKVKINNYDGDGKSMKIMDKLMEVVELQNDANFEEEENGSIIIDSIVIRANSNNNNNNSNNQTTFYHSSREQSEFKCIRFVESKQNEGHVESILCRTKSGIQFQVPLNGVSNEIWSKLWQSKRKLFGVSSSSSSKVAVSVEHTGMKNGLPVDPLCLKVTKKK